MVFRHLFGFRLSYLRAPAGATARLATRGQPPPGADTPVHDTCQRFVGRLYLLHTPRYTPSARARQAVRRTTQKQSVDLGQLTWDTPKKGDASSGQLR